MKRILVTAVALALVAAACGGGSRSDGVASLEDNATPALAAGDDGSADGATATTEMDPELALLEFTQCLRDNGVDVGDPEVDGDGNLGFGGRVQGNDLEADREAFQAAREACADILEGVSFEFRDRDRTEIEDTLVEFATCMRDNGYDMPDPDFSGFSPGSGGGGPFSEADPEDPAFIAANETCEEVLSSAFGEGGIRRGPPPGGGGGDS
ncbi:MAG: hypothetical protein OES13_06255 [Acidimicrobiia bacterium]|nr:hypothetical protein [Acidimicrobiia bacterium]